MWLIFCTLLFCFLTIFYIFVKQCHSYWKKRGIPFLAPAFFFGNLKDTALGRKTLFQPVIEVYNKFQNYKYVGFYKFLEPALIIRDPEIASQILIKDFEHFSENEMTIDENVDYIMSKNVFVLRGHQWKSMRSLLSVMFTSGKLKYIFPLSKEIHNRMVSYIHQEIANKRGNCINGKILCQKFTIDNVATCAFGLDAKAFEGETKFSMVVQDFNDNSYLNALKFLIIFMIPSMNKYLKIKFFRDEVEEYLTGVVGETLKYRKENGVKRNDFFDQIAELREKSVDYPFTDRDVVAQGAGFFVDGVEASSGVASYVLAELGFHQNVQQKVREEIRKIKSANNGELTYEGINEMTYLQCVINETLRLNSPVGNTNKVCTKSYTLPEINETDKTRLVLNPGDKIMIPIEGYHMNPDYFPDPHSFKPERFLDENRDDLVKNTFLAFGLGPRHCLGMRFALLQIKLIVCAVIGNYQLDINKKMLPFKVHPTSMMRAPLNGMWFDLSEL